MKSLGPRIVTFCFAFSICFVKTSSAQNYIYDAGTPAYTTALPVELGFINAGNGDLHLAIPLVSSPQSGKRQFSAALVYDSNIWKPGGSWAHTNVLAADQTTAS